ncbi:DUF1592 domain-containing protein [Bremerella sp. T1]|uniref:DUF1592 domain-containing protein n=1 Tax=Bremerella sp. TYQ1 TaxID=3119568 RepID=UPI001CC970C8|nr:DUF1592 domain-containing protein [Bremerella volcania]UBM33707.1 DUF1588 domain-containing protein [Bremerella volcania]
MKSFALSAGKILPLALLAVLGVSQLCWANDEALRDKGKKIYTNMCADCHGENGEGVVGAYESPLVGDASLGELSHQIVKTMPEGDAESCVGPDAEAVAAYMHYAFYSEAARIRNRPPQISLARLTGNQLRQSLADIYSHFHGTPGYTEERGVKGIYFTGARWKNENKKIERVDSMIDFDFGRESPGEGINKEDFLIHWNGSIIAEETGDYEIVVRSTVSFTMDFGKLGRTLIDNHVQSGDKTEFRELVRLTAGRAYPFKIDYVQRKRKTEQPPAMISLSWVPPHGTEQLIPERNLIPWTTEPTYSLQTKLPPDDRSYGFERGIAVDRQWDDSTTSAAIEFGIVAAEELWPHYSRRNKKITEENRERLKSFLTEFVEVAFRTKLSDELKELYINQQIAQSPDDNEAIRRVVLMTLKSPRFLYPQTDKHDSPSQQAANRLALTFYDSIPSDKWLLDKVEKNQLQNEQQVRDAAWRMVNDYRTRGKTREMLHEWLNVGHFGEITKDEARFPGFEPELVADMRASLDAFLDDVVWSEKSDYRQFFTADWAYSSDRMAKFYGDAWKPAEVAIPEEDKQPRGPRPQDLRKTASDGKHRLGLLTHPYLMSGLAYTDSTSPIHRGVFLIRYVLGRTLRPPNDAFTPLSPDLHPDLTTRERVALQTSPESCQVCHTRINGLGFTLEHFDAVGRFRELEKERPIDSTGSYTTRDGQEVTFQNEQELAQFLANSDDAHRAFVSRAFQHFVKQPVAAYGPNKLDELTEKFKNSGYSIRALLVEIAVIAAMEPHNAKIAG